MSYWNTPINPGAMTPADIARKIANGIVSVAIGIIATAIFMAMLLI